MFRRIRHIIRIVLAGVAAVAAYLVYSHFTKPEEIEISVGQPGMAKEMARLCSVEIYNEVPVLDTVNQKVIFAVQKQSGSISFDMENLQIEDSGDTVKTVLPAEIVEVYESTEKDSWTVIDTKAIGPMSIFRSDKLTLAEENRVKNKLKKNAVDRLYSNGTVRKARKDAVENLTRLLENIYRKPVSVADPTPNGIR